MNDTFAYQRARMLLNAKNYWMDRCAKAEADRDLTTSALKNLLECFPEEEIKAARIALAAVMEDKCQTLVY